MSKTTPVQLVVLKYPNFQLKFVTSQILTGSQDSEVEHYKLLRGSFVSEQIQGATTYLDTISIKNWWEH